MATSERQEHLAIPSAISQRFAPKAMRLFGMRDLEPAPSSVLPLRVLAYALPWVEFMDYWSITTIADVPPGENYYKAAYVCLGPAFGCITNSIAV